MRRVACEVASVSGLNPQKNSLSSVASCQKLAQTVEVSSTFAVAEPLLNFLQLFKSLISNGIQGAASPRLIGIVPASCSLVRVRNRVRKLRTSGTWCAPHLRV